MPTTRKECPTPKQLMRLFRTKKTEKEKTRLINHISACYYCASEFELILKALRYEGDIKQAVHKLIPTKKAEPKYFKISWRFASLISGVSLFCILTILIFISASQKSFKYRTPIRNQIGHLLPQKRIIPKSNMFFQWENVEDSEYYTFELYDVTLYQIWSSKKIFQNYYSLSKEISSRLTTNKTYFWMVSAYCQNGRKIESQLKEIQFTE
jgi:hypothetical protein